MALFSIKGRSRIASSALLWYALMLVSPVAYAAPSYTVTPLVIDESIEQRDILEHTITLENTGTAPVTIYPTVNNIAVDDGGGITEFVPQIMSDQTTSLAAWIEISRAGIDLRIGEKKTVTLTLRINPQAKPGSYHAFVGFPFGENRDEAERMVLRGDAPGTVVSVTLDDKRTSLLKLSRFIVDRFVTQADNSAAQYIVTNPGDEPLVPQGEVIYYDAKGVEVGATPVNPDGVVLQPGETKEFQATVPTEGHFGKHKAFLSVEYGTAQLATVHDTAFFYILPFKTVLLLFGCIALVVIAVALLVHKKYFDDVVEDGSELLPFHVRDSHSRDPHHRDIDLRSS